MHKNTIFSFSPNLMSPEILESILVGRHGLIENIIESVVESSTTANKHFRLLIAQEGVGKTHTIALIYHRLKARKDLRHNCSLLG